MIPTVGQMQSVGAYLFAAIDTRSKMVKYTLIMSDQRPTTLGEGKAWGLLAEAYGADFQNARTKLRTQIHTHPWLKWTEALLLRDE